MSTIILDCDGVLLDWEAAFANWLLHEYGRVVSENGPTSWDLSPWIGCAPARAVELIDEFNTSEKFVGIQPCRGAIAGVELLLSAGHDVSVVTSCHHHPEPIERRRENLTQVFGEVFDRVVCLPIGTRKSETLSTFNAGVWVEDNYHNAMDGHFAGHTAAMVRRSHNLHQEAESHPAVDWFEDLSEFAVVRGNA